MLSRTPHSHPKRTHNFLHVRALPLCTIRRERPARSTQVTDDHIQLGTIEFDTGFVNVVAVYRAICFRPFVNEVLDAAVSHVTELGFFAEVGPLEVFVSRLVSVGEGAQVQYVTGFVFPLEAAPLAREEGRRPMLVCVVVQACVFGRYGRLAVCCVSMRSPPARLCAVGRSGFWSDVGGMFEVLLLSGVVLSCPSVVGFVTGADRRRIRTKRKGSMHVQVCVFC